MLISSQVFISETGDILEFKDLLDNPKTSGSIQFDINEEVNFSSLHNLKIKEEFQRKGFASKLRSFAIQKILSLNVSKIITNPLSENDCFSNEELINFYKKNFIKMGAIKINEEKLYQGRIQLIAFF